ncbi:MAG: methyltransferase domain-containing protein [Calothrix sp. MO_192.B10]|nr:methyltransferase domain-containing protein [Calothrix sp. MO_192.B10]
MLAEDITKYGKWMYEFDLGNGVKTPVYSESINQVNKVRHSMIFSFLDSISFDYKSASVLDIACNEAYFMFEMLKRGAKYGLGIEGRKDNLEKASFIQQSLGYNNCDFQQADVLDFNYEQNKFDVVFLLGIIYHVENPIGLIRKASLASSKYIFIDTQLCKSDRHIPFGWGIPNQYLQGDSYFVAYAEKDEENPLASLTGLSLIPNLFAVVEIIRHLGFKSIIQLHPNYLVQEPQYNQIDRVVLVGIK